MIDRKNIRCYSLSDNHINRWDRSWKLGGIPTQGRCCKLSDSPAIATGRIPGKAPEEVSRMTRDNKSEYLPVLKPFNTVYSALRNSESMNTGDRRL